MTTFPHPQKPVADNRTTKALTPTVRGPVADRFLLVLGLASATVLALSSCGAPAPSPDSVKTAATLSPTTTAAAGDVEKATWAIYRATNSLDPIKSLDIPENAVVDSICDTLLRQQPDFSIASGLAESADFVTPTTLRLKLRNDAKFFDGSPMTAEDVVFSLERARDPQSGSFYSNTFSRVSAIEATGSHEVTISLSEPDQWLRGELAAMPGVVIQKAFAERLGSAYGTPEGGVMCTGPFTLKSWSAGGNVVLERNTTYWDTEHTAHAKSLVFQPVDGDAATTAALTSGGVDGYYGTALSTHKQLAAASNLTATAGPSLVTDAAMITSFDGALGDVRVRQALSLAINRQDYANAAYQGQATVPTTSSSAGTQTAFADIFKDAPHADTLHFDVERAKKLIADAGAAGRQITMATISGSTLSDIQAATLTQAAETIGLSVTRKQYSTSSYINLFSDPAARTGIDIIFTLANPNYADPAPFLAQYSTPPGFSNYNGYDNAEVTTLLEQARAESDQSARARLVAKADYLVTQDLPWIPMAHPNNLLYMSKKITGAPASLVYLNGLWADRIGAAE